MTVKANLFLMLGVLAFSSCAKTPTYSFSYAEQRLKLENNGLRVVLLPDTKTDLVQIDVRYEVGSKEDPKGKAGLAHLVEHMMFQQRLNGPDSPPLFEAVFAEADFVNAYTNWDTTHYMTQVKKEFAEYILRLEAWRFAGCRGTNITDAEFQREREVVRNEIRQRTGSPEGQIPQMILSAVYPKGHPYERMIGGDDSQLTNITLDDVCKFMNDYYVPERATLVIAGNIDPDEMTKKITEYFGKIPKATPAPLAKVTEIKAKKSKTVHKVATERSSLHLAWPLPPGYTREGQAMRFALPAIASRVSYFAEEYDFATDVSVAIFGGQHNPAFILSMELRNDSKYGEAMKFAKSSAKRAAGAFKGATFSEAHAIMKGSRVQSLESLPGRTGQISDLVQFNKDFDWDSSGSYFIDDLSKVDKINGDYIHDVVKKHFRPEQAAVIHIKADQSGVGGDKRASLKFKANTHEKKEQLVVDPAEAHTKLQVAAELKRLDKAQHFTMNNGMEVVLLPYDTLPVVHAKLMFRTGGIHDPDGKEGLAAVAARYLRPVRSIGGSPMDRVGISWWAGVQDDYTSFSAQGINLYLHVMVKGLERLIKAGEYNQLSIENFAKRTKERFKRKTYRVDHEFSRLFYASIFGEDHPYTVKGSANPKSAGAISRDAVDDFRRKHYSAKNATLVVVGNFDPVKAESLIRGSFGEWGGGHKDEPTTAAHPKRSGPIFAGVIGEDLPQVEVRIGYPAGIGLDKKTAARAILAAMLQKRVGDIREKLGSTYGLRANRTTFLGANMFSMGGTIDAPRAGESIAAMRKSIDELRHGVDFDEDFVRARKSVLSRLMSESTVTSRIAARLQWTQLVGSGKDYYHQLSQQVGMTLPGDVFDILKTELAPENEVLILKGGEASLKKAFKELGIESVKYVNPE